MESILERLRAAAEVLERHGDAGKVQDAAEDRDEYSFQCDVTADRLQRDLGSSLTAVLGDGFKTRLEVRIRGIKWLLSLQVAEPGGGIEISVGEEEGDADFGELSPEALTAVEALEVWLRSGGPMRFDELVSRIGPVAGLKVPLAIKLLVLLNKKRVSEQIESSVDHPQARVIVFLSPLRLAEILKGISPRDLDEGYFSAGRRTIFVIPAIEGALVGEFLAICGRDCMDELRQALSSPLRGNPISRVQKAHDFCDWQCDWPERPRWLTPETLSFPDPSGNGIPGAKCLLDSLKGLRSLLSIFFLAQRTRRLDDGRFEVRFGDSQQEPLCFNPTAIISCTEKVSDLDLLYLFAYDGSSADKLELVRQFLALSTLDVISIFRKARTVLEASQRAHARYLKKRVDEFFAAQRKTRDYVQAAVSDAESATMKMTQEVAENVYKTFGAVALVAVARALDPKLTAPAALVAAMALSIYLGVILFYYLPTVRKGQRVLKLQYEDHIKSFQDVLGEQETLPLIANERVARARTELRLRRHVATGIYAFLLVASLVAVVLYSAQVQRTVPAAPTSPGPGGTPAGAVSAPPSTPAVPSSPPSATGPTATPEPKKAGGLQEREGPAAARHGKRTRAAASRR
jgi:hypothetical protein